LQVPKTLAALSAYTDSVLAHPACVASACPEATVVWGWTQARAAAAAAANE
jgi:hypothetical protein